MEKLISIVIPCYNDREYIEQSVNSALNQTYPNIEVIVVDDGSNKKTKVTLKKLEPKISKLITQENKGQSTARNIGIRASKGEYILILDSDDYFELTFCEKAVNYFLKNENVKIVSCYSNLLFDELSTTIFKPRGGEITKFILSNGAMGTSMFRKKDWNTVDGYDESMKMGFEDWEFFIRILKQGGKAEIIKEVLYNYRKRQNSTTIRANKIKYKLLNYIYLKHKETYIKHYDIFIEHLLNKIENEEKEKLKMLNKLEYKIGFFVLKPFRWIKSLFR